jgi:pteridine reductase
MARTALVTGASRRVGREIALELGRAGYHVGVHCRIPDEAASEVSDRIREAGGSATVLAADLLESSAIHALFQACDATLGRLDVLVNSAAVFRPTDPMTLAEDDLEFHMSLNLKAPYLCAVEAASRMRAIGGGAIVNIADIAGFRPFRSQVPYCVSKAGLVMLTRALAVAWAPSIRVNAVAPGTVLFRDDEDEDLRRRIASRILLGRIGSPEDVARTVRFLVDGPAHITGAVIPVDGGRSLV